MTNECEQAKGNLNRFLDSDLSGREATDIAAHLDSCDACRQEFETLRAMRAAFQSLQTTPADVEEAKERVFARFERQTREELATPNPKQRRQWALNAFTTWVHSLAWRPALATLTAAAVVVGAAFFFNQPETVETPVGKVELPGPSEMSLLFELHDAHVGGLTGEDPVLRRTQAAEAHAALLQRADELVSGNL